MINALCHSDRGCIFLTEPRDVLQQFPVRKTKAQKDRFRAEVCSYAEKLGYPCKVEHKGLGSGYNVVMGDPEKAEYLVTAHYDTPARMPFPNFITFRPVIFIAYQLAVAAGIIAVMGIVFRLVDLLTRNTDLAFWLAYASVFFMLYLMLRGPANPSNANDNTSGVITVLETMAALPEELRERVCFVLFDLEEAGLRGSSAYSKAHKQAIKTQIVFNADCVGDGDHILLIPGTKVKRKKPERIARWKELCLRDGEKAVSVREKGFVYYPSDQKNFPWGVGMAAFRQSKQLGLHCNHLHTPKDKTCDQNNIVLLRDTLLRIIAEQA